MPKHNVNDNTDPFKQKVELDDSNTCHGIESSSVVNKSESSTVTQEVDCQSISSEDGNNDSETGKQVLGVIEFVDDKNDINSLESSTQGDFSNIDKVDKNNNYGKCSLDTSDTNMKAVQCHAKDMTDTCKKNLRQRCMSPCTTCTRNKSSCMKGTRCYGTSNVKLRKRKGKTEVQVETLEEAKCMSMAAIKNVYPDIFIQ